MKMAGTTGLEPATSDVTGRRSNQLNYVPDKPMHFFLIAVGQLPTSNIRVCRVSNDTRTRDLPEPSGRSNQLNYVPDKPTHFFLIAVG